MHVILDKRNVKPPWYLTNSRVQQSVLHDNLTSVIQYTNVKQWKQSLVMPRFLIGYEFVSLVSCCSGNVSMKVVQIDKLVLYRHVFNHLAQLLNHLPRYEFHNFCNALNINLSPFLKTVSELILYLSNICNRNTRYIFITLYVYQFRLQTKNHRQRFCSSGCLLFISHHSL